MQITDIHQQEPAKFHMVLTTASTEIFYVYDLDNL
jgi:hypothetical protein